MTKIKCTVDSCVYWGQENICQADEIKVKQNLDNDYEMEVGQIGGEADVATSAETMCETFKPRLLDKKT